MKQYVIIGNSAAGIAALEAIRKIDRDSKLTVISDEAYGAYCRCLISYYLAGDIKEDKIIYRPESFYKENNIELLLGKKVNRIDPKKNRVILEDKTQVSYDSLLIATGASPKMPEIKGIKKEGVFSFRTIKDTKDIEGLLLVTKTACILGGGLVGLKAAYALKKRNVEVKVVVKSRQVLSQILDLEAAQLVQKRLEENGIELILGQDVTEIIGEGEIRAVKLESGKAIAASLVIAAKGVSPNIDLVKDTEIKISEGIVANNLMQTNVPNIYSAGDVCEAFDVSLGETSLNALWPVAVEQGKTAGLNMAGQNTDYPGSLGMNSLEFFGLPTVSLGNFNPKDKASFKEIKSADIQANIYRKLILKGNLLVGAILAGNIRNSGVYLDLIKEKINLEPFKNRLLEENFGYPDIMDFLKNKERVYV